MNTSQKLDYVRGKLGLIPAFGDSIGKAVNKAELGLCAKMAADALAVHRETVAALENALRLLGDIKTRCESHAFLTGASQPANVRAIHELTRDAAGPMRAALERATRSDYGRTEIKPGDLPDMPEGGTPSPTRDR